MTAKSIPDLEAAGFSMDQVRALAEYLEDRSVTRADFSDMKGEMKLLRWMVGLSVALNLAILLRLLF